MTENPTNALAVRNFSQLRTMARSDETLARFAEVVGKSNASAYISSVLLAAQNSDKLMECSPQSIITSAMRAATLRLSVDPNTKQAHLVPFKGKATLVIGYKGYYDMAIRTGRYRYLNDFPVFEGETVEEDRFKGIHHIRGMKASADAKPIGYMLYFQLKSGLEHTYYMTVDEIKAHAARYSKTYKYPDSLWQTDFEKMARKTIIRMGLQKYGYFDPNDRLLFDQIDESETEEDVIDQPAAPKNGKVKSEAEIMGELGFGDDHQGDVIEGEVKDEQPTEPPATLFNPGPADPYADIKAKAETDPKAAARMLANKIGWKPAELEALAKENGGDWSKTFAGLLRNAPPAN